ncbi:hypothetical protein D918_08505 [Trichuris suis]|uniref:Uncharacterized protein n=1 Tax=Trichuris suis TaxID=68888 RepID=A0A085M545_9BILA|nr:hypothetical protein M513_06722 [Trichuris suis]KHJ41395.1 hypothetical protein D918_08505 [Trichuris suis]
MANEPVYLNVYSMNWVNDYLSSVGVGIYHSGIEVYGTEYCFGRHRLELSGIFEIEPKCEEELGDDYKFKVSILQGYTDFTRQDVLSIVQQMGNEYQGNRYHLMNKNCNHFTDALSKILCGKEIPGWVNRLAFISSCIPFLERCFPREWITPAAAPSQDGATTFGTPNALERRLNSPENERTSFASSRNSFDSQSERPSGSNDMHFPGSPRHLFNNVMDFLSSKR